MSKRSFNRGKGPNVHRAKPKKWIAKCPKCEEDHEIIMHWEGGVKPRKYCDTCRGAVGRLSSGFNTYIPNSGRK